MDAKVRRRASRDFGRLVTRCASLPLMVVLASLPVRLSLGWSSSSVGAWVMLLFCSLLPGFVAWDALRLARRIRSLVPMGEAARIWSAQVRRTIAVGRSEKPPRLWHAIILLFVIGPVAIIVMLPESDVVGEHRLVPLCWVGAAYLLSIPLMMALLQRARVTVRQFSTPTFAIILAVFPALLCIVLLSQWMEARAFRQGAVTRETVIATIGDNCSERGSRPGRASGSHFCLSAETSHGELRWSSMLSRDVWIVHERDGRACVQVTLEHAPNGAVRLAGGQHRIRSGELTSCRNRRI
jgi:hypothetical protein